MYRLTTLLILCVNLSYAQISLEYNLSNDTSNFQNLRNQIKDNAIFLEMDSNNTRALFTRANLLFQLQEHERAIKDYNRLAKLDENGKDPYTNRGFCYVALKKYKLAIIDFNYGVAKYPNDPVAWLNRAYCESQASNYEKANMDLTKAIQLRPTYVKAYGNRAFNYKKLRKYKEAIRDYTLAIELDETYVLAYYGRGNAYLDHEQFEEALTDYNKALQVAPGMQFADLYLNIGVVKIKLNDKKGSSAAFAKAADLALYPEVRYYFKGLEKHLNGYSEEALADLLKAIEMNPEIKDFYKVRADIYDDLKRPKKSKEDREKFEELNN